VRFELIHFGQALVAFALGVRGDRVAVSYRICKSIPHGRVFARLERELSFDAPEAQ
jgi:hypothetical protein